MNNDIHPEVLSKLRRYDTPTISNIIELFNVRSRNQGFVDSRIRACFPELAPAVGFAATITCRTAVEPHGSHAYTSLPDQVARFDELSGPPLVVFQDLDDPPLAATFGEIMCTTYQAFGAVGLITNGPGRDLAQVQAIGFPVFTNGAAASHGYIQMLDVHAPVRVGGLAIYPDDLLHGDRNGIVTIPRAIAADVADVADAFVAAEQVILDALHTEGGSVDRLREAIRESQSQIDRLRQRVSRQK
ncbi:MAG: RraA family protein [Anaerolineae bacterium]|nr:RraA family protein [Anaerolineae bacterium]